MDLKFFLLLYTIFFAPFMVVSSEFLKCRNQKLLLILSYKYTIMYIWMYEKIHFTICSWFNIFNFSYRITYYLKYNINKKKKTIKFMIY